MSDPDVFVLYLNWDGLSPSLSTIFELYVNIPGVLQLSDLYKPQIQIDLAKYCLSGIISKRFTTGNHRTFIRNKKDAWYGFNNEVISLIHNWNDLIKSELKDIQAPVLLFYQKLPASNEMCQDFNLEKYFIHQICQFVIDHSSTEPKKANNNIVNATMAKEEEKGTIKIKQQNISPNLQYAAQDVCQFCYGLKSEENQSKCQICLKAFPIAAAAAK